MKLLDLLIGRKLANREGESEKITAIEGVPAMGLDGLASSAYGPEAALTMLAPLGVMGLAYMGPVMLAVLAVLAILYVSYWQTIEAYPTSGGSYTVAHENLGANAGLLAATALMIDYVLNVAVGISAGVGALTSAVPALHPYTLWLCLGILVFVTLINLRGTFEAGLVFAVPTYLFDEVDAGVGGKAAVEVGRRLARLARSAQVVVVTHLPQVAAFADRHLVV